MNELETYLSWVASRLDRPGPVQEEPDFELKSEYSNASEHQAVWELADLLAALANDVRLDGFRSLIYGPCATLDRPEWLPDEARLRDKLIRHFDGGVVPGVELVRRDLSDARVFDAFVVLERDSVPYVTRLQPGGTWAVRVRTNTSRRTATRAEILALAGTRRATGAPVRRIDARLAPLGKGTKKIVVTNAGTIAIREIRLEVEEGAGTRPLGRGDPVIELLNPGERDNIPILGSLSHSSSTKSERVTICGVAVDGERVSTSLLISAWD